MSITYDARAVSKAERGGFEPAVHLLGVQRFSKPSTETCNPLTDQDVTENTESVLASCLAFLRRESPDLAAIVEAWETLPPALKAGILAMVEASKPAGP